MEREAWEACRPAGRTKGVNGRGIDRGRCLEVFNKRAHGSKQLIVGKDDHASCGGERDRRIEELILRIQRSISERWPSSYSFWKAAMVFLSASS